MAVYALMLCSALLVIAIARSCIAGDLPDRVALKAALSFWALMLAFSAPSAVAGAVSKEPLPARLIETAGAFSWAATPVAFLATILSALWLCLRAARWAQRPFPPKLSVALIGGSVALFAAGAVLTTAMKQHMHNIVTSPTPPPSGWLLSESTFTVSNALILVAASVLALMTIAAMIATALGVIRKVRHAA